MTETSQLGVSIETISVCMCACFRPVYCTPDPSVFVAGNIFPVDEQEADILLELYRDIVEEGPDLFSMHDRTLDAPFR